MCKFFRDSFSCETKTLFTSNVNENATIELDEPEFYKFLNTAYSPSQSLP